LTHSEIAFPLDSGKPQPTLLIMTASTAFFAGIFGMGPGEMMLVLAVLLLLFGATKLPALAKGLGQSMKEFKKASRDEEPEAPAAEKKPEPTKTHGGSN
jgi:sec-independent protein translocase protein TatA